MQNDRVETDVETILERAAYYAWCLAWADHNDRLHEQGNAAYVSLAGSRIEDYAPETPADSWLADWNRRHGGGHTLRTWATEVLARFDSGDAKAAVAVALLSVNDTTDTIGYYLVMEALGHGVSMSDNGGLSWHDIAKAAGCELPHIEAPDWFGAPGAEDQEHDAWSWVDGATEAEILGCLDALGYDSKGDNANRAGLKALMRDGDVELDDVSAYFGACAEAYEEPANG